MSDVRREQYRAGWWTLAVASVLVGVWALACGPPDAALAEPANLDATVQQATDSTVVVSLDWSAPSSGGPVDGYRWRAGDQSGEVDSTSVAAEVPRRDTAYSMEGGVAAFGPGGEGPEATTMVSIPARTFEAPGSVDSLQASVDTVQTASVAPDSVRLLASRTQIPVDSSATLVTIAYYDGSPHGCAVVDGVQGWYLLSQVGVPPTIDASLSVIPDDRPECGGQWQVEDEGVLTLDAPTMNPWPVESTSDGGGHGALVARPVGASTLNK